MEEGWRTKLHPTVGHFSLPDGNEVPEGRVQLLPDTCIVKISELEWWCEDVQAMTNAFRRVCLGSAATLPPLRDVCLL